MDAHLSTLSCNLFVSPSRVCSVGQSIDKALLIIAFKDKGYIDKMSKPSTCKYQICIIHSVITCEINLSDLRHFHTLILFENMK